MTGAGGMLTVGALFAGIGGLEKGLEDTGGFKTVWSNEICSFCNQVRRRHGIGGIQYDECITEFIKRCERGEVERPDVICGGFPCQGISCAGKQLGLADDRSGLFFEMLAVVRILRPQYVILENVRRLFSINGGKDFRTVLGGLSDLGYDSEWTMLRAEDFGYPHGRARVFVVAYRQGGRSGACRANEIEPQGTSWIGRKSKQLAHTQRPDETRGQSAGNEAPGGGAYGEPGGPGGASELAHPARDLRRASGDAGRRPPDGPGDRGEQLGVTENIIPHAPPGPGLTHARLKDIIKLYAENPKKAKAVFEAEREQTERWAEILDAWPWLAPAVEPGFCGVVDGIPSLLDPYPEGDEEPHIEGEFNRPRRGREIVIDANRPKRIRALGNAVMRTKARWIGGRILEWECSPVTASREKPPPKDGRRKIVDSRPSTGRI
jgi:DNA-cytosine methyltransferase